MAIPAQIHSVNKAMLIIMTKHIDAIQKRRKVHPLCDLYMKRGFVIRVNTNGLPFWGNILN